MTLDQLTSPFPWMAYSKKLAAKIENPRSLGSFDPKASEERGVRLVEGFEGEIADGNAVRLYWLVDKEDGGIVDAKFRVFGQSALIGAAQIASDLIVGKNYDQARRISADLLDKQVRDRPDDPAFPSETAPHLNLVIGAIEAAAEKCGDIPLSTSYVAPPVPTDFGEVVEGGYPGWEDLEFSQKLTVLEEILDRDIRPYIALDGGGVEVINFLNDKEVVISYQGNCTSCYSSVGATLSYIQQTMRNKVHPDLVVVPSSMDFE